MLKRTKFSIGGYNFDDWGLVKELYVPTDISSSTDRSLHVRGREDLPGSPNNSNAALRHHLQHYVIPYDKVFIAFALANARITTTSGIGLFGTGKAYGRYPVSHQQPGWGDNPGAPIAWSDTLYLHYNDETPKWYYGGQPVYGTLVLYKSVVFECRVSHWPTTDPAYEPSLEGDTDYWYKGSEWDVNWKDSTFYFFNELELVTVEGVEGAYMCMEDHTSSTAADKPCSGTNWDYGEGGIWNPGDEFQADLSSQFGFAEQVLSVSEGTDNPFSREILAVFKRTTENRLRRIDAKTTGDTMKAGASLWGIEVDA